MPSNFVIDNVRVFSDSGMSGLRSVAITDGLIADDAAPDAERIDGGAGTLLPGFIDTHVHLDNSNQLAAYGKWGVTTVLDMGAKDWESVRSLGNESGVPSVMSAGAVACAVRGTAVRKMGYPASSAVSGPQDAARFIADRTAQGVDYVKIVMEENLPFQPKPLNAGTVEAIITEAHSAGLLVCVHATSVKSFEIASRAGADVLTHAPLAGTLNDEQAAAIARRGLAVSPTLVMMKTLVEHFPFPIKPKKITYDNAVRSVQALHRAGASIIVGTDSNSDSAAPNTIEHGVALHDELELLVKAGLTPIEALNGATGAAADVFRLTDRGRIATGLRGDLLLVNGDPTVDIRATRNIARVWIAGEAVAQAS